MPSYAVNGNFLGRKSGYNKWVCSASRNSNSDKKATRKFILQGEDSSLYTGCPYKVTVPIFNKPVKRVMVCHVYPFHNHLYDRAHAKVLYKKSGKATSSALSCITDILAQQIMSGQQLRVSDVRKILRPIMPPRTLLGTQDVSNILRGCQKTLSSDRISTNWTYSVVV